MNVKQLIQKLQSLPQDLEVTITDGYQYHHYEGDYTVEVFEDVDGIKCVDIGIGDCYVEA